MIKVIKCTDNYVVCKKTVETPTLTFDYYTVIPKLIVSLANQVVTNQPITDQEELEASKVFLHGIHMHPKDDLSNPQEWEAAMNTVIRLESNILIRLEIEDCLRHMHTNPKVVVKRLRRLPKHYILNDEGIQKRGTYRQLNPQAVNWITWLLARRHTSPIFSKLPQELWRHMYGFL